MNKHVWVGLTHIYGIGRTRAKECCDIAGVSQSTKVKDLTDAEVTALRSQIAKWLVEGDLRRDVSMNIKRLPVRGQRTRTNARTRKGPRKQAVKLNAPPGKA
jgi:small subunit ribosomal protein S13